MNQKFKDNITENVVSNAAMLVTTKGLMVMFEKIRITDGLNVEVNMVDLNQLSPEMKEVERRLQREDAPLNKTYAKSGESLMDYLALC